MSIDVTWLNAGTAHIKTNAVNLFIEQECIALVRNEKSIKIVKDNLLEKGKYTRIIHNEEKEHDTPVLCDDPLHDWDDFTSL